MPTPSSDGQWPEKDFEKFRDQRLKVLGSSYDFKDIAFQMEWMRRYIYKLEKALNKLSPERVAEVQGWPYDDTTPNPRGMDADSYYEDYQTERHTRRQQAGYDPI